jgi:TonB family protein
MSKPTINREQLHDNQHLSLQLMQEYLEEMLPDKQMHRVERHLLDCELCSDALEGLSFMKNPEQAGDSIDHLKRKVRKRSLREPVLKRKKKKAPLLWRHISVAAATIIMVVGSILVFRLNSTRQPENSISLNKEKARITAPAMAEPEPGRQQNPVLSDAAPVEEESNQAKPIAGANKARPQPQVKKSAEADLESTSNVALSPEVALDQIEEALKNEGITTAQESVQTVPQTVVAEAKREDAGRETLRSKSAPVPSGAVGITQNFITVSGKVATAADTNIFLPGVKVSLKGTNKYVLADYRGRFSIAVPPGSSLIFSMEGMSTAEVKVTSRKSVDVLLKREGEEEISVDETPEEIVEEDNLSYKPQPENGTMSYRNYLKKNLKYPQEARKRQVQGNVRVEFMVKPDGQLTDFTIKKGLGYGCDEEALRLIKEGPAWKPAIYNGKKVERKITVFVPFKL